MASGAALVGVLHAPAHGVAVLVALAVMAAAALLGGLASRRIRRASRLQLASAVGLAALVVPVALAGGAPAALAFRSAGALAVVFLAGALAVRGTFARARRRAGPAWWFDAAAAAMPLVAAALFAAAGEPRHAVAVALAAAAMVAVSLWRPTPRQLRPVGLGLGAVVAAVVAVLGV
jgi:hypothetical protein